MGVSIHPHFLGDLGQLHASPGGYVVGPGIHGNPTPGLLLGYNQNIPELFVRQGVKLTGGSDGKDPVDTAVDKKIHQFSQSLFVYLPLPGEGGDHCGQYSAGFEVHAVSPFSRFLSEMGGSNLHPTLIYQIA